MGLVSCEMLQRGFDVPDILCGIDAHPWRKSLSCVVQQAGRAMRAAPGKEFALWLDPARNCLRHRERLFGFWDRGIDELVPMDNKAGKDNPDLKGAFCRECKAMMMGPVCGVCGWSRPRPTSGGRATNGAVYVDGKMISLDGRDTRRKITVTVGRKEYDLPSTTQIWRGLCFMAREKGKDPRAAQKWCQANFKKFTGRFHKSRYDEDAEYPPPHSQLRHAVEHSTRLYIEKQKRDRSLAHADAEGDPNRPGVTA